MEQRDFKDTPVSSSVNEFPVYKKPPNNKGARGVFRLVRRYWYVVVAVVLLVVVVAVLQSRHAAAEASWKRAEDSFAKADYASASKELVAVKLPDSKDTKRLTIYSQTMLATRQLDKALPGYERLYAAKKDPSVKLIIANIYNEKKQYDKAEKTYDDIIASDKNYIQAYVNLATLKRLQAKKQDAAAVAKLGVENNPSSVVLHELYVSMLMDDQSTKEYADAVAKLRQLNPNDPLLETLKADR